MTTKSASSTHHPRLARYLALAVAGLLAALPGHARATLFDPILEATISGSSSSTTSASTGPVSSTYSGVANSADAWTNYGINRAAAHIATSTDGAPITGYWNAKSKWTEQFTVTTSDVALYQPISFLFSFRLDGILTAHEDNNTVATASVRFSTASGMDNVQSALSFFPSYGLDVTPTASSTAGGDASVVIHETLSGTMGIYNGTPFDLSATLEARTFAYFIGPQASLSADSLFYNTAEWAGGSVQVNGSPVSSFTITSGSGHNYNSPAPVPEPATILLLGSGLAGLGGAAWRRKKKESASSDRTDA